MCSAGGLYRVLFKVQLFVLERAFAISHASSAGPKAVAPYGSKVKWLCTWVVVKYGPLLGP